MSRLEDLATIVARWPLLQQGPDISIKEQSKCQNQRLAKKLNKRKNMNNRVACMR
ncbi:hypothetical protein F0252_20470 [Vibrio hepatarius]|nr:hypothetical protein [Vibrio hepatarius]